MKYRLHLYLCIIFSTTSIEAWADTSYIDTQIVNNEKITQKEISLMDPVCRLILIDKPGIHLRKNMSGREILNNPAYEMAKDAPFLHHRCWALIAKQRYFSTHDKGKKSQHFSAFKGDMNYIINNAPKNWKFLPQIHTELGQMNLLLRYYSTAILSASKALNLSRTHIDAYILLSDAYRGLGNSESQAKKYILEGLEIEPGNKQLMLRAKRLNLTIPANLATPTPVAEKETTTVESLPIEETAQKNITNELIPSTTLTTQGNKSAHEATNPGVSTNNSQRKNPYCRFCPD